MEFFDKSKAFLKQFTEGLVESPAFSKNIKISHTVVKGRSLPTDIKRPINEKYLDSKSTKCKAVAKNNATKIKNHLPDRNL